MDHNSSNLLVTNEWLRNLLYILLQPTAQIIPQAQVQHLTQQQPQGGATAGTSGTQLVKTVLAPAGGIPIPVSTGNINVSMPQQKGLTLGKLLWL